MLLTRRISVSLSYIYIFFLCVSEEDAADTAVQMEESPAAAKSPALDAPKIEEMSTERLLDELSVAAKRQSTLVAQLAERRAGESSLIMQKDEEISLLRAQLADEKARAEAASNEAKEFAVKKEVVLAELAREGAEAAHYRAECQVAMETLEKGVASHLADVDSFRKHVKGALAEQEQKIQMLSTAYNEELYPLLMSTIAERRYN